MLTVALVDPQIPPNTGNIARLCGATNVKLDLIGNLGFSLEDKYLKRAGLDYWEWVNWEYHADIKKYFQLVDENKIHLLTTKAKRSYVEASFGGDDVLIFGSETKGLDEVLLARYAPRCLTIPMVNPNIRSLNLSSSAAIVLYEALRQCGALEES